MWAWRNPLRRRNEGDLAVSYTGPDDQPTSPIPEDPCGPTAHAGHLGTELRDAGGTVVTVAGRSAWLCLEHDVVMWAPRSSE